MVSIHYDDRYSLLVDPNPSLIQFTPSQSTSCIMNNMSTCTVSSSLHPSLGETTSENFAAQNGRSGIARKISTRIHGVTSQKKSYVNCHSR